MDQRYGSYVKKLIYHLEPDKRLGLLVMHYGSIGMSERSRIELRNSLSKCKPIEIFIGRMNLCKGRIKSSRLPADADAIDDIITGSTILMFGVPCCQWWLSAMKIVQTLVQSHKGNLVIDKFFLGYNEVPLKFLKYIQKSDCHDPNHTLTTVVQAGMEPESPEVLLANELFSEKLYQSFLKLNANILHCSLFDVLRLLLPMLAQGRLPFICQRIDSAVGELIKLCLVDFESMNNIPEDSYNIFFLESVLTTWDDYCSFLVRCQEILAIMNSEEWSVMQVGFTRWRNDVINSSDMGVPNVALQLIQKHRNGSAIDTSILLGVTRMLSQLDVYAESFENRFLADTICHYKLLSNELSVLLKGPDHIAAFFLRISEEIDNCSAYLVGDTNQKLITLFRGLLLGEHFIRLKTILVSYDDDSDQSSAAVKELSVIYDILEGGRHGRDLLIPGLKDCFFAAANSFKCSSADLHLLIKYMTHCKMLIQNAFKGDSELIHAFYNSLSGAVNSSV